MPKVGSHNPQAKDAGSWKNWSKFWAKHGGVWKRPVSVFVKSGGSWVEVWDEAPVITNVTTSYVVDTSDPFAPNTTYYKNFTVSANGFQTTLVGNGGNPFFGVTISQPTIAVDNTVNVTTYFAWFGTYDPAMMHTVTATNASGSVTV
jgi:hypothetical protein